MIGFNCLTHSSRKKLNFVSQPDIVNEMTTKKVLGLFAVGDEQFCGATAIELG
jgi:hypothetical protein